MSEFKYNNPPGIKPYAEANYYSQTVDLGNGLIKASGQGGWTVEKGFRDPIPESAREQVENAFKNVDHVLKEAGLSGARAVFQVRTYHIDIEETLGMVTEGFKKFIGHRPVWTAVQVAGLADKRMKIEVEVQAKANPDV
jgi:enamine deaminase RidA (YjgF/YER057c/UK114 family)